jgi:hypothetical protein
MSRDFADYNKDPDSPAAKARRADFLDRMTQKLAYKESLQDARA